MRKKLNSTRSDLHAFTPIFRACLIATVAMAAMSSQQAFAAAGWAISNDGTGAEINVQTFYASSPSGKRLVIPKDKTGAPALTDGNTGKALRKFIDPLPLFGVSTSKKLADGSTDKYIPIAVPEKWINGNGVTTNDDYYEIAVVEYTEKLHSDLKKATTLRGYVQLVTPALAAKGIGRQFTTFDGQTINVVDKPHFLGPVINASEGVAVRMKFVNMLPVGRFDGVKRNGDLFIPVDETFVGAGYGPDGLFQFSQNRAMIHLHGGDSPWISDGNPHQWITPAGEANPAIAGSLASQGADPSVYLRGQGVHNVPDMPDPGPGANTYYFPNNQSSRMLWYHDHTLGLTRLNVYSGMVAPYMLSGKDDAPGKLGDSTVGGTIPSDSAAIPLIIQDKTFVPDDIALQDARWNQKANGTTKPDGTPGSDPVKLWGEPGDLWFPHVYEFNQDPSNGLDGTSPPGRWDWGPYFWPVFPALYNVPSGFVGDASATPESYMDTPLVNGVAYPKLTVQPQPTRFKILNASNDRFLNLGLYVADSEVSTIAVTNGGTGYSAESTVVTLSPDQGGSGATASAIVEGGVVVGIRVDNPGTGYTTVPTVRISNTGTGTGTNAKAKATVALNTEVKMVQAVPQSAQKLPPCEVVSGVDIAAPYAKACWPSTWPADGRDGGVPDPAKAGPKFYQVGNETGLLPQVAEIPSTPMGYEYNRRSVTVLNAFTYGLFMGTAERADIVVDFSQFAGKTLILYNDSPAPVPAFDPRIDYYTGSPDQTGQGGVEGTTAGYGPNTRTIMQIYVDKNGTPKTLDTSGLTTALPKAYAAAGKEPPIVAQAEYNGAFQKGWTNDTKSDGAQAFANIFTGSRQQPQFKFTPGDGKEQLVVKVTDGGSGYTTSPVVTLANATGAEAVATMKISAVTVTNPGSGYLVAPSVTFTAPSPLSPTDPNAAVIASVGIAAEGMATLKVDASQGITLTNHGSGYTSAPAVLFSLPSLPASAGGIKATGHATLLADGTIGSIVIDNAGAGYDVKPNVQIALPTGTGRVQAKATVNAAMVDKVFVTSPNPNKPELAGGRGYTDLSLANMVTLALPPQGTRATAAATGSVETVTITKQGSGYTGPVTVAIAGNGSVPIVGTASATAASGGLLEVKNKAIQELFDPTYGRMNATFGVELPFTSALTQTTIPLGYIDPPTEEWEEGVPTLWKITHNGVDTHPVHFHLVNVQVINRIGWDGTVKPPRPNELGWKETVKMHPLEDIVVAMRAKKPILPGFGLPRSIRALDPSQPLGVPFGFTQVDTVTGNPATVVNKLQDYDWEYTWHCHILGHEENDFMRPIVFHANEAAPTKATGVAVAGTATGGYTVTWTDAATTEYEYRVLRATADAATGTLGTFTDLTAAKPLLANSTSFVDSTITAGDKYVYQVMAVGANGSSTSDNSAITP
jgi:FtsP/CotA-like multicopper oxidase with cupredoxin domain